jgi:hypothetical protein
MDLQAKVSDCLQFGMGRTAPVTLLTVKANNTPDSGWEVFYTCITIEGQSGGEIRAGLTPMTVQLAPGWCTFRARKDGRQVITSRTPVFTKDTVPVEVVAP